MVRVTKDPDERYQEFIQIAVRLFSERDYEKVTIRDILAEVNGTQGMFYHYFDSKEDLYKKTLKILKDKIVEERYQVLVNSKMKLKDKIKIIVEQISADAKQFRSVTIKEKSSVFRLEMNEQMIDRLVDGLVVAFRQALITAEIKENNLVYEENLVFFAAFFISGINGALCRADFKSDEDLEVVLEKLTKTLLTFVKFEE